MPRQHDIETITVIHATKGEMNINAADFNPAVHTRVKPKIAIKSKDGVAIIDADRYDPTKHTRVAAQPEIETPAPVTDESRLRDLNHMSRSSLIEIAEGYGLSAKGTKNVLIEAIMKYESGE